MRHLVLTAVLLIAGLSFAEDVKAPKSKHERKPPNLEKVLANPAVIKEFDKDNDGKLSDEEKGVAKETMKKRHDERRAEMIKKFDKDADGKLSPEEHKAMRDAMKSEHKGKEPSEEKRAEMTKKFDKDGDGKLSPEEHKAMRDAMKAERKAKKAE